MTDDIGPRVDFAGIHALSSRAAGYSVAAQCLEVQNAAEKRDPSLRTETGVTLHAEAWSWFQGARGEMRVGELLTALGPEWFVRHAVPIGAGTKDVDHLVIGPGGVFAINTKHHAGASIWVGDFVLSVNRVKNRHLNQSAHDGADVAHRLASKVGFPVAVTPTLAFLDAKSIVDDSSDGTRLASAVDARRLVSWLTSRPRVLSDTELALINIAAEEPETWHVDPRAADTLRVMQRFERLVAQVGTPPPSPAAIRKKAAAPGVSRQRPRRSTARTRGSKKLRSNSTLRALFEFWFTIALVIGAMLAFREFANQPCSTPVGCVVPSLYAALKPILLLGALGLLGAGAIGTLVWIVRRATR